MERVITGIEIFFSILFVEYVFVVTRAHYDFDWSQRECPQWVDSRIFYSGAEVPYGITMRAFRTLPRGFLIKTSAIPAAGLGVFTTTFLPQHTWLGEYEGDFLPFNTSVGACDSRRFSYSWSIHSQKHVIYHVDGSDVRTSNWLRFINCARHKSEENVAMSECYGRIYYRTSREIAPNAELLINYGPDYLTDLGIDVSKYFDPSLGVLETKLAGEAANSC